MALRSGLTLWCYTAPTATATQPLTVVPYQNNVQALRFTTVNPGGYGEFSFDVYVPDARIPRPELQIFSRVVIRDGLQTIFIGEITDPPVGIEPGREYIRVQGLGLGNCLRDDPYSVTYTNQTARQIAVAALQHNTVTLANLPLDADTSLLFPDNPAGTNSPGYDSKTLEEVITDVALNTSNTTNLYTWWTAAHAVNRDIAGFPTLQVAAVLEDFTTVTYQASLMAHELTEYSVEPSAERSANYIQIAYNNGASGIGLANAGDTRLNPTTLAQNTAPFRFKKILRDLSSTPTVTSTLAAQIATWLLTEYQNGSNKVHLVARAVRDANGNPVELWSVNALNTNFAVPEAAVRGATLPTGYTAGVNLFHIKQTTYNETTDYAELQLDCDNFADGAAAMIARLQTAADIRLRSPKTGGDLQSAGQPIIGQCGVEAVATAGGQKFGQAFTFPQQAANTPSSIALTQLSNTNATSPTISQITALGAHITVTSVGSGPVFYEATYKTAGN